MCRVFTVVNADIVCFYVLVVLIVLIHVIVLLYYYLYVLSQLSVMLLSPLDLAPSDRLA